MAVRRYLLLPLTIALVLCAGVGWGADYHVNSVNGSNANAGTSAGAAWLDLSYADDMVSAGDAVTCTAGPTNPFRDIFYPANAGTSGNPITFQGPSASMGWISGMVDVTNGTALPGYLPVGNMESWENSTIPWEFVLSMGDSEVEREATTVHGGTYAMRTKKVTNTATMQHSIYLPDGANCTLTAWHNQAFAAKRAKLRLTDETSGNHLQSDGSWGATATFYHNEGTVGAWNSTTVSFEAQSTGEYSFYIFVTDSGQNVYLDDISINNDQSTALWSTHSGDTYKLVSQVPTVRHIGVCSTAEWSAGGVENLRYRTKSTNLADCVATVGEWWYENGILYYHLASGETISGLHIEASVKRARSATLQEPLYTSAQDYIDLNRLGFVGGYGDNIDITGGDGLNLDNIKSHLAYSFNVKVLGGTADIENLNSTYAYTQDGLAVGDGGVVTGKFVKSSYAWDEGIEVYGTGNLTCTYCISEFAGQNSNPGSEAFAVTDTASIYLDNCVGVNAPGAGLGIASTTGTKHIRNSAFFGTSGLVGDVRADNGTSANLVVENCAWEDSYDFWDTYVNATSSNSVVTSTPGFTDLAGGNYTLTASSPLIDAGTDVGLTTDYAGTTVPQDGDGDGTATPDIGAYEYVRTAVADAVKKIIDLINPVYDGIEAY